LSFVSSHRLVWFNNAVVALLSAWALATLKEDAIPLLVITCPAMLGLVSHWQHVANKTALEEKKLEKIL